MADDRQNLSTMAQLASLRNFMDERRGRTLPHPVGAAITTIKHLDDELANLREKCAMLHEQVTVVEDSDMRAIIEYRDLIRSGS